MRVGRIGVLIFAACQRVPSGGGGCASLAFGLVGLAQSDDVRLTALALGAFGVRRGVVAFGYERANSCGLILLLRLSELFCGELPC